MGDAPPASDLVRCERLRCTLSAAACVRRQLARRRIQARGRRTVPLHDGCGPAVEGDPSPCPQGAGITARVGPVKVPAPQAVIPWPLALRAKAAPPPAPPAQETTMPQESPTPQGATTTAGSTREAAKRERAKAAGTLCAGGCGRALRADSKAGLCCHCRHVRAIAAGKCACGRIIRNRGAGPRPEQCSRCRRPDGAAGPSVIIAAPLPGTVIGHALHDAAPGETLAFKVGSAPVAHALVVLAVELPAPALARLARLHATGLYGSTLESAAGELVLAGLRAAGARGAESSC